MLKLLLATAVILAPVSLHAQEQATEPAPQASPTPVPTPAPVPVPTPGSSAETAYKVKNIGEEYAIMRKLGIKVDMQSLIMGEGGHPYDVLSGTEAKTHEKREIWFDIKSFYGKELGF
jgi:hypothetical protein